jgi:hypothetical protein
LVGDEPLKVFAMNGEPELRGDRLYTIRVTFISLAVGVAVALVVGLTLISLRQPLTTNSTGGVVWNIGAFMLPLAGLLSMAVLAWSVFWLPVAIARRQGVVLDPQIWPATGVIALTVVIVVLFVGAMIVGVI